MLQASTKTYPKPWRLKILEVLAVGIIGAVTLLPILNISIIIATTGANNPSSDDLWYIGRFLGNVLDGTYNWQAYFRDTFYNTHSLVFPAALYILVAYFARLNIYVILWIGIMLAISRLVLLHDALTRSSKHSFNRFLLWPLLAGLVFSTSQISMFEHGITSASSGFNLSGFALSMWGLVRFPGRWRGIYVMVVGGLVSGPLVWPAFLIGLILLNYRQVAHYVVWLAAGALTSLPYVLYLFLQPPAGNPEKTMHSLFNQTLMIDLIGLPFAEHVTSIPRAAGLLGIALFATGLILLWSKRKTWVLAQSSPALMLFAYSIFAIWQISVFRGRIMPWYVSLPMLFWIGLLGLAYVLWVNRQVKPAKETPLTEAIGLITPLWCLAVVVTLVLLYARSNITYLDKTVFLRTRAPASAACLRNYLTAPTYCERTLVIWPVGDGTYISRLARPLEHHHLSVFAPHQQWTLQGDFVLDSVRTHQTPDALDIFWSQDLTNSPVPWSDHRHLNLFLHTPNAISWTVSLPANIKRAEFHSAIALSRSVPFDPISDGATFEVYIEGAGEASKLAFAQHLAPAQHHWYPFSIPLSAYAGKTIALRLTSSGGKNIHGDWAMYRYPYIDLLLSPAASPVEAMIVRPSNTDLSPLFPRKTANDFRFDVENPRLWQISGMRPRPTEAGAGTTWIVGHDPFLQFRQPLSLCLADFTHFYVRLAASPDIPPTSATVYYQIDGNLPLRYIEIPLLSGGKLHEYTYDLKLLELNKQSRLTSIRLDPVGAGSSSGESRVHISDFRLIHGDKPSLCTK